MTDPRKRYGILRPRRVQVLSLYFPTSGWTISPMRGGSDESAVVDDTLELLAALQESAYRLLVLHLLRDDEATGKCIKTAGRAAMLLGGLGKEQVTSVLQVRSLVEVSLERAAEETEVFLLQLRVIALLNEEVLLMHDTVVRQDLNRLGPCRVQILCCIGKCFPPVQH